MSGFVFFAIFVFVIIPMIKNAAKSKPAKKSASGSRSGSAQQNWSQVQELLQQKINEQASKINEQTSKNAGRYQYNKQRAQRSRDAHGHSAARKNTHQRLHARDGNTEVFPESHMARVRKRDTRDRSERNRIEAMLHSKRNRSITRESNKGVDTWGERGDTSGGGNLLFVLLFGLIAFLIISKVAPDLWSEILRALNN